MNFGIIIVVSIIAVLACAAATFFHQRSKDSEKQRSGLEADLAIAITRLRDAEHGRDALEKMIDNQPIGLGMRHGQALLDFLTLMDAELDTQINSLRLSETAATTTLPVINENIENARVAERIKRFTRYQHELTEAGVQIRDAITILVQDQHALRDLILRARSGRLNPALGNMELIAVSKVLDSIRDEGSRQLVEAVLLRSAKAETDYFRRFREAMALSEERIRASGREPISHP